MNRTQAAAFWRDLPRSQKVAIIQKGEPTLRLRRWAALVERLSVTPFAGLSPLQQDAIVAQLERAGLKPTRCAACEGRFENGTCRGCGGCACGAVFGMPHAKGCTVEAPADDDIALLICGVDPGISSLRDAPIPPHSCAPGADPCHCATCGERPSCSGCGKALRSRDISAYQANGGVGFPDCCEGCAEVAAAERIGFGRPHA